MTESKTKNIDFKDAWAAIYSILENAKNVQKEIAVAVCDSYGELIGFGRTPGCNLASITVAISKAFSAARLRESTRSFHESGKAVTNLADNRYTSFPGGFPLEKDNMWLGGIGVSGLAPEEDEVLALQGVEILNSRLC